MTAVLQVATPEGDSGKILTSAGDYLFRYREDAEAKAAISLLMPVRLDEYRHRELHPIFQMNLPEGYVLEQLRNRLAKVANVDPMLLLALSGSSSPIGRVAVSSPEVDALLRRQQFPGEKLEEILAWDGAEDIFCRPGGSLHPARRHIGRAAEGAGARASGFSATALHLENL